MNNKFKRLSKPRLAKINTTGLIGHLLPLRTKENSAIVGNYIDNLVRLWVGASTNNTTGVDLEEYGIEVKSQDIHSPGSWTVGNMTFDALISTNYIDSSLYQKLQSLFLVKYDNDLCQITDATLCYLDSDEIQSIIEKGYETARREAIAYQLNFKSTVQNNLFVYGDELLQFNNSQQFKGTLGYLFEYTNSGNSFKFRISHKEMKKITKLSMAINHVLFQFE